MTWAARLAERSGLHYGWVVVAVTFAVLLSAAGIRTLPVVVMRSLEDEFGWDRAAISLAVALSLVIYGLAGPFSGRLIDRFGPRALMLGGVLLTCIGSAAMLVMSSLVELSLWYGLLVGVGTGTLALVMGATVANRWFVTRRGLVTGILGAGTSAGQLLFVPAFMGLTLAFGWRAAAALGVGLFVVVIVPLVVVLMRDAPADVGFEPYGAGSAGAGSAVSGPLTPVSVALRTTDFWLLASSFFICGFTSIGLIGTHLIPHAVEHGFSESVAAGSLALLGAMNVVGTMMSGYLTDRFNPRRLLAAYYAFRAASLVMLPAVTDVWGLTFFAVLFGLDYIATVPPTVALTADRFGRRSLGAIFGWIACSHQIGAAIASYFGGAMRVSLGDYSLAFIVAGLLAFVASGLSLRIHRPDSAPRLARPVAA